MQKIRSICPIGLIRPIRLIRLIRPIRLICPAALLLCAALAGCKSYTWGTKLPAAYRNVAVPMFANSTTQPEIEALLTQDVRREIINDSAL